MKIFYNSNNNIPYGLQLQNRQLSGTKTHIRQISQNTITPLIPEHRRIVSNQFNYQNTIKKFTSPRSPANFGTPLPLKTEISSDEYYEKNDNNSIINKLKEENYLIKEQKFRLEKKINELQMENNKLKNDIKIEEKILNCENQIYELRMEKKKEDNKIDIEKIIKENDSFKKNIKDLEFELRLSHKCICDLERKLLAAKKKS